MELVVISERGAYSYNSRIQDDPVYSMLNNTLDRIILKPRDATAKPYTQLICQISFKYIDGVSILTIIRKQGFYLNGIKMSRDVLLGSLSRIIYRSCFNRSADIFNKYIYTILRTPPNVRYALENRSPYSFYEETTDSYLPSSINVRINTRRISAGKCAIEISENIWGAISVEDLDLFLDYYRMGKENRKNKAWALISPRSMWKKLFGSSPTESEYALMVAWLKQNRTEKMVEDRAMQLMVEIEAENENIINFTMNKTTTAMFVRGNICDWILTDSGKASGPQRVNIYCFHEEAGKEKSTTVQLPKLFLNGRTSGPICVNNSVGNVSLGDQFASRAFTLLNDRVAMKLISTLRSHMPKSALKSSGMNHRINMTTFLKKYKSR